MRLNVVSVIAAASMIFMGTTVFTARDGAHAASPSVCALKGKWRDSGGYNLLFLTDRLGLWGWQANVQGFAGCPGPWTIAVTPHEATKFSARVQDTNTGCGQNFSVFLQFAADCRSASGHFTNALGGGGQEVWTRIE